MMVLGNFVIVCALLWVPFEESSQHWTLEWLQWTPPCELSCEVLPVRIQQQQQQRLIICDCRIFIKHSIYTCGRWRELDITSPLGIWWAHMQTWLTRYRTKLWTSLGSGITGEWHEYQESNTNNGIKEPTERIKIVVPIKHWDLVGMSRWGNLSIPDFYSGQRHPEPCWYLNDFTWVWRFFHGI